MFQLLCTLQRRLITPQLKVEQRFAARKAAIAELQVTDLHFGRVVFVAVEAQTHTAKPDTATIAGTQTYVKANALLVPQLCVASVSRSSVLTTEAAIVVATEHAL